MLYLKKNNKSQVWVESVLYTLIGLTLIGIALAIVTPKISESRDRILVDQTINSLNYFNDRIDETIDTGPGNARKIDEFTMKNGTLIINSSDDNILLILDNLRALYSEAGVPIENGRVTIISEKKAKTNSVSLILNYRGKINLTYDGSEEVKKFSASPTPYTFLIENKGNLPNRGLVIDLHEISRG